MDHRTLHKSGTLRLTIPTYVDEVLTSPSSITVTSYLNGSATGDSITPSIDALGTGLSTITYTPAGTAAGDTLTLKISATISGTTRVTVVDVMIVDTAAMIASAVWNALTSALTTAGSIGKYLLDHIVGTLASGTHSPQSGDAYARLGAPAGASVSADIAAVLAAASSAATAAAAAETAAEAAQSAVDGLDVIPAAQASSPLTGTTLNITRGDKVTINLSSLGSLASRAGEKLYFTIKRNLVDADSLAVLQVTETTGAVRIEGAAATAGDAAMTVTNESTGAVTIVLYPNLTKQLKVVSGQALHWDIQRVNGSTDVQTLMKGLAYIDPDASRAVP